MRDPRPLPLPDDPVPFVGRAEEAARLREVLTRPGHHVVLHGQPDVGKSALAYHLAREAARATGAPVYHQSWSGYPEVTLVRLLGQLGLSRRAFMEILHLTGATALGAVQRLCAEHFAERQAFVVLDDVPTPAAGRELLAAFTGTPVSVVLTCREGGWDAAPGILAHQVEPLGQADSLSLAGLPADVGPELMRCTGGLPLYVRIAGGLGPPFPESGEALVRWALSRLLPVVRSDLGRVGSTGMPRFSTETWTALLRKEGTAPPVTTLRLLEHLVRAGLLSPAHSGTFALPTGVSDLLGRDKPQPNTVIRPYESQLSRLITAAPAPRRKALVDEYLDWVVSRPSMATAPPARLSDHDQLVALLWTAERGGRLPAEVRKGLFLVGADAALEIGCTPVARRLLRDVMPSREQAVLEHHSGNLYGALEAVDRARLASGDDERRLLTVRASILIDQGFPHQALTPLARSGSTTSSHSWFLELSRLQLLLGRADAARTALESARATATERDDDRQGRLLTQEGRLLLLSGRPADAHRTFRDALSAHRAVEDLRGEAWAHHYIGLALADMPLTTRAQAALFRALVLFKKLPDKLGEAWTLHHLGLLARWADPDGAARVHLHQAEQLFTEIGCPHGSAWTALELGLLYALDHAGGGAKTQAMARFSTAEHLFLSMGDESGLLWAAYARTALSSGDGEEPLAFLRELVARRIPARHDVENLIGDWRLRHDEPSRTRYLLPRRARDTIAPSDGTVSGSGLPTDCHVRLTLLDNPTGTAILLRVVPGDLHPWASAGRGRVPWLTAVATPLTRGDIEPATGLVRPSHQGSDGAEFRFTPHRPGIHRIRFTIAHESTGTVLQQVETEIDIADSASGPTATASDPAHVRGL
ncbi:hypothetical protein ACIRNI_27425 [Streptomyces sp. NPDC093546]|uniref:hypothetical protein n=1 Tax=Streptomyces sp. NPDC093546 TaxID=3366040 RepID=UPI00382DD583